MLFTFDIAVFTDGASVLVEAYVMAVAVTVDNLDGYVLTDNIAISKLNKADGIIHIQNHTFGKNRYNIIIFNLI